MPILSAFNHQHTIHTMLIIPTIPIPTLDMGGSDLSIQNFDYCEGWVLKMQKYQNLDSAILRTFKVGRNVYSKCSSSFIRHYSFCRIRGYEVLLLMTVLVVLGRERPVLKLI